MTKIKSIFLLIMGFSISFLSYANSYPEKGYVEYEAVNGLIMTIEENKFEEYISASEKYIKNLKDCRVSKSSYYNPFLGESGYYKILGENSFGHCIVSILNNGLSKHKCALDDSKVDEIIKEKSLAIKNKEGLEFLGKKEARFYNDKDFCKIERIKVIKRANDKEVEEILNKNPHLKNLFEIIN